MGSCAQESPSCGGAYPWPMPRAGDSQGSDRVSSSEGSARVLLVEDEPGIVDFVKRGLESEGFSVQAVMDGGEGERLALSEDFDAIVLDLMLPTRSGLEILASVRLAKPSVPVIVLTARGLSLIHI